MNGAKLAGSANLKESVKISDVEFLAGAVVKNYGGPALKVSNANAEAEGFKLDAIQRNESIVEVTKEDGILFFNGNTVTLEDALLDFGTATAGMVYAGKELSGNSGDQEIICNLRFNNVTAEGSQIFGGGKVSGSCQATITGTTSTLTLQGTSTASRLYAGYDVMESADTNLTIKGNSEMSISGGTYDYIRGGVAKSEGAGGAMTVEGDATTSMNGASSVFSLAGDYQVGANAQFTRTGDVRVSVGGEAKIEGDLVGAGLSFGGTYTLTGNSTLTISGGTIEGDIYGGIAVGNTGNAIKDSAKCKITGQTEVKIDCSTNTITLGKENEITSIFVGSFAKGEVSSLGTLRVTGKEANLTLKGVVELIGDSSAATNKKSYVGSRRLLFEGFTGELGVQNIAAFETVELRDSDVKLYSLVTDKLADVSTWVYKGKEGQSTLSLGGDGWELGDDGFFNGDKLELTFDEALTSPWTLMKDVDNKGLFNDLSGATVKFNGVAAAWDETKSAFVSGNFSLGVGMNNDLVLKLASA